MKANNVNSDRNSVHNAGTYIYERKSHGAPPTSRLYVSFVNSTTVVVAGTFVTVVYLGRFRYQWIFLTCNKANIRPNMGRLKTNNKVIVECLGN